MAETRFATIVLVGRPNAGKSTMLNALVGEKLAITSRKAQSTRLAVSGIRTVDDLQLEFVDPPGLFDPSYPLQHAMLAQVTTALARADGVIYLHPATDGPPPALDTILPDGVEVRVPVLTVLTKGDRIPPGEAPAGTVTVSAKTGAHLDELIAWCRNRATPQPFRYAADDVSGQPVRFFAAEFIREAAFAHLGQELPYAIGVEIEEFRETADPIYVRASLFVERKSQKGMVIGKAGATIKRIGTAARAEIERLLDTRVYLDLQVKVLPKWRHTAQHLRRFGLPLPDSRSP